MRIFSIYITTYARMRSLIDHYVKSLCTSERLEKENKWLKARVEALSRELTRHGITAPTNTPPAS